MFEIVEYATGDVIATGSNLELLYGIVQIMGIEYYCVCHYGRMPV